MTRNDNLNQFDDLIDELRQGDERPYPPRAFKNQLRSNLLNQYGKSSFSLNNLGRLARTAVALGVLGFIVIYAWSVLSQPGAAGGPIDVTRPVQATPKPTILPVEPELAASSFRDGPLLNRHALSATQVNPGDTLNVTLFWDGEAAPNTNVALHLTDASGILFSQADQPLTAEMTLSLPIPETLADGVYEIVVVRYDAATGVRQDSFLLQEIGVGTAVPIPERAPNDVWLIAATQHARQSADDPIMLEITVGYQFAVGESVTLKPLYAAPDWESATGGRLPIDGLGDEIVLDGSSGTYTFIFSENPATMREIVGTDQPVIIMQLAYQSEDASGNGRLNILTMPTLSDFAMDLTSTEEIAYP